MDEMNRRTAFQLAGGAGLLAVAAAPAAADDPPGQPDLKADRERVIAAGAFFALPKLHPMDAQEVATAVHVVQHKLLARPTYRKYLELAKGGKK